MKKFNLSFLNWVALATILFVVSCSESDPSATPDQTVHTVLSDFKFLGFDKTTYHSTIDGKIENDTIKIELPKSTDLTKLKVSFSLSENATANIDQKELIDFSSAKKITVTGKDKDGKAVTKDYVVIATVSKAADPTILEFGFGNKKITKDSKDTVVNTQPKDSNIDIDQDNNKVIVTVPQGTNLADHTAVWITAKIPIGATLVVNKGTTAITAVPDSIPVLYELDLGKVQESGNTVTLVVTGSDADGKEKTKTYDLHLEWVPVAATITKLTITKYKSDVPEAKQVSGAPDSKDSISLIIPKDTALTALTIKLDLPENVTVNDRGTLTEVTANSVYSGDFSSKVEIKVAGKDKNNAEAVKTFKIVIKNEE